MKEIVWPEWEKFLSDILIMNNPKDGEFFLFRGQPCADSLLPKIARKDPRRNTLELEKKMLADLRLRGSLFLKNEDISDIDLLAIAQHHGMATRLLDWTTNPLVALWFACFNTEDRRNTHFYIYRAGADSIIDRIVDQNIFSMAVTKIFRPKLNNSRVIAQQGWFSIHTFRSSLTISEGNFIGLDEDIMHSPWVWHVEIPEEEKSVILAKLSRLGVNYESVFPDLDGICRNINWQNHL